MKYEPGAPSLAQIGTMLENQRRLEALFPKATTQQEPARRAEATRTPVRTLGAHGQWFTQKDWLYP